MKGTRLERVALDTIRDIGALPGWRLGDVISRDFNEKPPDTIVVVRRHGRETGLRPFMNLDDLDWTKGHLNDSSYRAFCSLAGYVLNQHGEAGASVLQEIAGRIEDAGDTVDTDKLVEQFASAFGFVARQRAAECLGAELPRSIKWPDPDPELIASIGQEFAHRTLAWWELISPARASEPEDVLPVVFLPKALVCYGPKENVHFVSELGEGLYQIAKRMQCVVPNPAKARFVNFADGTTKRKCVENFPERRFLIVEFDRSKIDPAGKLPLAGLLDLQAALHAHLATEYAPLAMLVFSGHESLHGWYPTVGVEEEKVLDLLRYACRLGADHCLSATSFFTRMPCGTHENGRRQSVHYLNPGALV